MKQRLAMIWFFLLILSIKVSAQAFEVQQLLLNAEKLDQLKKILDNMYKGYEVVSKGYSNIKDLTQGNFNLHEAFLDGLMQVSPAVRKYKRIADIIEYQTQLVKEYKIALSRFKTTNLFNENEIKYIGNVYDNLFQKSLQNLDELLTVITAGQLRMSDDERIKAIDRLFNAMSDKLVFLRIFNKENDVLVIQRGRAMVETKVSQRLNGL